MNKLKSKLAKSVVFILIAVFVLSGCSPEKMAETVCNRREAAGDVCLSQHAATYIELFKTDYKDMNVTKVRWQALPDGAETYVIEGNNGKTKSIVKYLCSNQMVLGRTEREFLEEEIDKGKCTEKELIFENILTFTELCDIALKELGGELQELRVVQDGERIMAYAETRDERLRASGMRINAQTGEKI